MGHSGRRAFCGIVALVIALLGVTLLVVAPAIAGDPPVDPPPACEGNQGLVTANLGV